MTDLRASSSPGVDHAYYLALSQSPQLGLTWTHNNSATKAEVWRLCLSHPVSKFEIPTVSHWGLLVCGLLMLGVGAFIRQLRVLLANWSLPAYR